MRGSDKPAKFLFSEKLYDESQGFRDSIDTDGSGYEELAEQKQENARDMSCHNCYHTTEKNSISMHVLLQLYRMFKHRKPCEQRVSYFPCSTTIGMSEAPHRIYTECT